MPCLGAVGVGGNGKILVKATEVINTNHIIELKAVPHPAAPPLEIGGPVILPAVQRVPPDLTVRGKGIRRTARDGSGSVVLVQLEQLRVSPYVGTVGRDIDGNVAHDLNVFCVGIGLQLRPLLVKLELQVFLELHVKVQLPIVVVHGKAPVHPNILGPLSERRLVKIILQRHEQGEIIQPPGVAGAKSAEVGIFGNIAALIGLMQQREPVLTELDKIDFGRICPKIHSVAFLPGQHALFNQRLQADHVGISGKGGIGLIGGIVGRAVGGSAQRQNLPVALAGFLQPVNEIVSCLIEAANAIFGWQTGDGQQNTCITVHKNTPLFQNHHDESSRRAPFLHSLIKIGNVSLPRQYSTFSGIRQQFAYPQPQIIKTTKFVFPILAK